jgi:hypothetical protein
MSLMPLAALSLHRHAVSRSRAGRRLSALSALLGAAALLAPSAARAEPGAPLPPGYTSDIPAAPAPPPGALAALLRPVSDTEDDEDAVESDYADTDPSALSDFQEPLAPYGSWEEDATYGTVWVPSAGTVGADFAPYQTAGHWSLTDQDEWLWESDYEWGYIPFHYGRWLWINARGWAWIPGRVYSPAWVSFRVGDGGYFGWAPMPPTWYWSSGIATNLWVTPYAAYCFVPSSYAFSPHVHNYVVRDAAVVRAVATNTRPYTAARPSVVGGGVRAHRPYRVASPTLAEAGVPGSSAPKARISYDPRARAFATRNSTAITRSSIAAGHGFPAAFAAPSARVSPAGRAFDTGAFVAPRAPRTIGAAPSGPRDVSVFDGPGRAAPRPSFESASPRPSFPDASARPSFQPASPRPSFPTPAAPRPSFQPASPRPSFPTPAAPRPSFQPASPRPSFPTPAAPRPSFQTYTPPSRPSLPSYSAPSAPRAPMHITPSLPARSAPTFHFSGGGGARGGGGHHR